MNGRLHPKEFGGRPRRRSGGYGGGERRRGVAPDVGARRFRTAPRTSVLGVAAVVADRRWRRALGLTLLPRRLAPPGVLIPRCASVHTFGMRFRIDVVFLDAAGRELERRRVPPRRIAARRGAHSVLELPALG